MSSKCKPSAAFDSRVNRPSSNNGAFQRGVSIKRKSARISSKPTLDLNKLSREMRKQDFPDAIKLVLTENVPYKIIKCKLDTSGEFGPVLHVDVAAFLCKFTPCGKFVPVDGKVFSTYFSVLYTNDLIKKVELQGCSLETSPELLIGLKFIYCGEVESAKGIYTYSKLEFPGDIVEDYSEVVEFIEVSKRLTVIQGITRVYGIYREQRGSVSTVQNHVMSELESAYHKVIQAGGTVVWIAIPLCICINNFLHIMYEYFLGLGMLEMACDVKLVYLTL